MIFANNEHQSTKRVLMNVYHRYHFMEMLGKQSFRERLS